MTLIAIASLAGARRCIDEWKPDAILSVVSPSMAHAIPTVAGSRHLRLLCHDIEAFTLGRLRGPTSKQIGAAIRFTQEKHERLLVHCGFGLSRAPAFALVALVVDGWTPSDAASAIRVAVPTAQPNRRILTLADGLLDLGGSLSATASVFTYRRAMTGARGSPIGWFQVRDAQTTAGGDLLDDASGQAAKISPPPAAAGGPPR